MTMARTERRTVRPAVEGLEDRQLLAGHIAFDPGAGILAVSGTPHNDRLLVSYRGNKIKVNLSGGGVTSRTAPRSRVREIVFYGNGGADSWWNTTRVPVVNGADVPPPAALDKAVPSIGVQGIIDQTNAFRAVGGLPALTVSAVLMQVAQAHAANMARQDRYGDTDTNGHILDGHDVVYRVAQVGYQWSWLGENVAYCYGYSDPAAQLITQWWNSPDHRANILGSNYTEFGVGLATGASGRTYAVQVFARPA
jgi:uncharacterized protein YkwD